MTVETRLCGLPGGGRWVLRHGSGMGSYGKPEDHPERHYYVAEYRGSRSASPESLLSLSAAATEHSWVPEPVRAKAAELLDAYRAR